MSTFFERVREIKGDLSNAAMAERCGLKTGAIAAILKGSMPSADKAAQIAKGMDVNLEWLITGEGVREKNISEYMGLVDVPIYSITASAGAGQLAFNDDPDGNLPFKARWLRSLGITGVEQLAIIYAQGDSMRYGQDDGIGDGDLLLVDQGMKDITFGGIYVIDLDGRLLVKRLQLLTDRSVNIISDNPSYPVENVTKDAVGFLEIKGRVVWHGRHLL